MKNYISILFLILVTSCSSQDKVIKESAIVASYRGRGFPEYHRSGKSPGFRSYRGCKSGFEKGACSS